MFSPVLKNRFDINCSKSSHSVQNEILVTRMQKYRPSMIAKALKSMKCMEPFLSTSQFICNCMQTYRSGCRSFVELECYTVLVTCILNLSRKSKSRLHSENQSNSPGCTFYSSVSHYIVTDQLFHVEVESQDVTCSLKLY